MVALALTRRVRCLDRSALPLLGGIGSADTLHGVDSPDLVFEFEAPEEDTSTPAPQAASQKIVHPAVKQTHVSQDLTRRYSRAQSLAALLVAFGHRGDCLENVMKILSDPSGDELLRVVIEELPLCGADSDRALDALNQLRSAKRNRLSIVFLYDLLLNTAIHWHNHAVPVHRMYSMLSRRRELRVKQFRRGQDEARKSFEKSAELAAAM